jgi:hypothetical protein
MLVKVTEKLTRFASGGKKKRTVAFSAAVDLVAAGERGALPP